MTGTDYTAAEGCRSRPAHRPKSEILPALAATLPSADALTVFPRDLVDTTADAEFRLRRSAAKPQASPFQTAYHRSDWKAVRNSSEKSSGCSQAAKWPPLSTSLK